MGKLYENIVFLHLRRQTKDLYYFKKNQEVDFYARIEGKEYLLNVSYIIENEKTRKRELDGLIEAMEYFHLDTAYLITKDEESIVEIEGKKYIFCLCINICWRANYLRIFFIKC